VSSFQTIKLGLLRYILALACAFYMNVLAVLRLQATRVIKPLRPQRYEKKMIYAKKSALSMQI